MDRDVVLNKLESLRRCVARIEDKTPASCRQLADNLDLQDIIVLNLERAVQQCVDIGLHVISDLEIPAPETMAQTFASLERAGCLDATLAGRMTKAVGFRNTAVHAYQEIDWRIVFAIITRHLDDFREFTRQIMAFVDSSFSRS
ncbi:DUF86 domain-containing protein [uncultured Desulfuromonas sp.]|uniref:type VII toxin-antitoxin system HepT family RNase toxin n=1 Tax=uncultured Desulfuromonas sp. TaxID=181013 RepID=UPI002AAAFCF0|nr:DUF86 domain-containing protein [uncultured Desulfuromonas sp.]